MKKGTAVVILYLLTFCTVNATDYYVDATIGSNTPSSGSNLTDPWQTITYALSQVTGSGHIIHVAAGYYDTSLGESFPIYVKNGVSLEGAGADVTVIDAGYVEGTSVIYCIGITDASTYVEGFFITGGYYYDTYTVGAGIYISAGSTLTIKNNTIYDNYLGTWGTGGGIYMINSSPKILDNLIAFNGSDSWGDGNAIAIINSSPLVQGNDITYNLCDESYSCIYVEGSTSTPRFVNNVIAVNSGAGIYFSGGVPTIINNTISNNGGCGIYLSSTCAPDSVINNIISYNSEYGIQEGHSGYDPAIVSYNMFFANSFGLYFDEGSTGIYSVSTLNNVAECENNIEGDPLFVDWYNGDYYLSTYSPAIDAGDPAFPYNIEPDPNGSRINIGAYGNTSEAAISETPPVLPADLYVDAGSGSNTTGDGSSGNPWQTITYALSQIYSTGHTVHVAAGIYNEALGENFPIVMKNEVSLSGEDNTTTIIDATGSDQRVLHCIGITNSITVIEGFTIMGGYLSDYGAQGAGIYISAGSLLTLRNNIIRDNNLTYSSHGYGAGIFITNSAPFIIGNIIRDNSAYYGYGTAIAMYNSSPRIRGNVILSNIGTSTYSSVYFYGISGNPELTRNVIVRNTGDAISVSGSENVTPKFINNTISDNAGNGIILSNCIPDSITNNIFSYNAQFGIYESGTSSDPGIVSYNLFYANSAGLYYDEGSTDYYTASTLNSGVSECSNNIDGDPAFKDRNNNDYRLKSTSVAIDAGDPDYPYDPDGSRIDIGAYYYILPPPAAPIATSATNVGLTDFTANWNSAATASGYYLDIATNGDFTAFVENFENKDVLNLTSYSVTGLSANTEYYYRVRAYNEGGTGSNSNVIALSTTVDPPAPPSTAPVVYAGTDTTQTSFLADWEITDAATSYSLDVATDITFSSFVSGYNDVEVLNATELQVTGLTASTEYFYRVRACNSGGCSGNSDPISVITLPDPPPAPVAYEATDITQNSFMAHWDHVATADFYLIDWSTDESFQSYSQLQLTYTTAYTLSGLEPNTTYYYRILAYNNGGPGDPSNIISVTTLQIPAPPAPVANNPSYIGQTDFTASWNSSETATGYYLDICYDSEFTSCDPYNLDVGNVTSYSIMGLTANTPYYYRVRAYNDGGTSDNSNIITVATLENPPDPPGSPLVNPATDITQTSFTANWQTSTDATGYLLDIASDDAFTNTLYEDIDLSNTTSYNITDLTSNTIYYYRLRAYNSGGTSDYSGIINVTTLPEPPPIPLPYEATAVTTTGFTANWDDMERTDGYKLSIATDDMLTQWVAGYLNLDVFNVTSYVVTGLDPNTTYYYCVRGYNEGEESDNSGSIMVTTLLVMPDLPAAPTADPATNITQTQFQANWTPASGTDGFYLDVAYDDAFSSYVTGYNNLDIGYDISLDIGGLSSNTVYYYRVRGHNVSGTGDNSNVVSVTTLPDPPPAPTGLSASSCNNEVYLQWDQTTEAGFMQYNVYWGTAPAPSSLYASYNNPSWNAITISDLVNGQTYYFRVTTVISPGVESDYSTTTSVKVKTGVIPRIKSKWGKVLICYNPNDSLTSFQWFVGTSLISGATAQYHVTAGQSGYYYVVTSDHGGCYNHSNLVYISGSKSISVYPNPAKSNFTLNLSSDFMGETVVTIYNSTGIKSVEYRTEKRDIDLNCEIPVGNLKDGIYTIEVNVNDEEIEYTKLIIIE